MLCAGSLTANVLGKGGREWCGSEGTGWSLGCDRSADGGAFGGLVGGHGWTAALTRGEYDDFVRVRPSGIVLPQDVLSGGVIRGNFSSQDASKSVALVAFT